MSASLSMFSVSGMVMNVFDAPEVVNKETGEVTREEKPKVQIMGNIPQSNGQIKFGLADFSIEDKDEWMALRGERVVVPIGMFAAAKNTLILYIPKGCHPAPLGASKSHVAGDIAA